MLTRQSARKARGKPTQGGLPTAPLEPLSFLGRKKGVSSPKKENRTHIKSFFLFGAEAPFSFGKEKGALRKVGETASNEGLISPSERT